jgi:hypothetical protein
MIDEDYKAITGMNQSLLKHILKSPQAFLRAQEKYAEGDSDEEHFVFGSMVDHLLTEDTPLEDKYYFMEAPKCSDSIKAIVRDIYDSIEYDNFLEDLSGVPDEDILQIIKYHGYQSRWGDEARLKAVRKDGNEYFKSLIASKGKIIVPAEERDKAIICKAALLSDPYTKKYFTKQDNVSILYKFRVEYNYDNIDMKGELDMLIVDHNKKVIIPIDIKTVGDSVYSFPYNFWRFRYDFQAVSYRIGVEYCQKGQEWLSAGYKILPFRFIVVEKDCNNPPLVYEMDRETHALGFMGGERSNGQKLEGFVDAIARYTWHLENDKWDYPREYYQKGLLTIER